MSEPAVILLSGLLCDETVWADVSERLPIQNLRTMSFPNFSSLESMAEHVLEQAPAEFVIVGHSMGGRVALEIVRQAADRVRGLALCNTGVHPCRGDEPASRGRLVALATEHGMQALAGEWLPPMMGASPARVAEVLPRLLAMVQRQTLESFIGQVNALLRRPDAQTLLRSIRVPTLLMSATGDTWSPVAQHKAMKEDIRDSVLVAIDDAGHMAPVEQPDAVAAALREWLSRLRA